MKAKATHTHTPITRAHRLAIRQGLPVLPFAEERGEREEHNVSRGERCKQTRVNVRERT